MSGPRKGEHPSVILARRFVEAALRARQFPEGERLPALRILARKARVSPSSMLRALHLLETDGSVTIVKNHGTYAGRPEDRVRPGDTEGLEKPPREKWRRLRMRLEQDIYGGRFPKGLDLPSLRDLAPRYGTSHPTLRKAMVSLERSGVVELHGRAYRVPRPSQMPGQAAILFTACVAPEEADLWFRRDRYLELLASMHRACAEANLRLIVSSWHPRHGIRWRGVREVDGGELRHVTLRGHLAWAPTLPERELQRLCSDLALVHGRAKPPKVGTREAPLAIFDGARGTPMSLPRSRDYACARIFSIARKRAGESVARHLLALGHRRIAFLSACHAEPWSKDRLFGLRLACEAAGFPDTVKPFTLTAHDDFDAKPDLPMELRREEAELGRMLDDMEERLAGHSQDWLAMGLRQAYGLFRLASRTGFSLGEAVERLRAWGPTAVVAANDVMALTAMHQLRRAGVRIPQDMAFTGFDDDKHAADGGLTSYSFNMPNIAASMLQYVLAPEKAAAADGDGVVECQGVLIERATTPHLRASG